MCTALTFKTKDFYFGRNLDYTYSYGESVTVMPRAFPLILRSGETLNRHFAVIGMAHVRQNFPLFYDGMNEKGLCMAGLNFVGNAVYGKKAENKNNIAQFEFLPWVLSACDSVDSALKTLKNVNITDEPFEKRMPAASLHYLLADKGRCVVIEPVKSGLKVYENPVGVLANNPPFNEQIRHLGAFRALSPKTPKNTFSDSYLLPVYSRGMGTIGLPGDLTSPSRFVRAAFVRAHTVCGKGEAESVSSFFHILGAAEQQKGCCIAEDGKEEYTIYSSCCNADKGIYYYKTYASQRICAVGLNNEDLDGEKLICYPLHSEMHVFYQN